MGSLAASVETALNSITAPIESVLDPVTIGIEPLGQFLLPLTASHFGLFIETFVAGFPFLVQPLIDGFSTVIESLLNPYLLHPVNRSGRQL